MKILISGSTGTLGYGLAKYLSLFRKYEIIKHELDTARDLVSKFQDSPTGTLKISCNPLSYRSCCTCSTSHF